MARWQLKQAHYLNVPGTEWEYKEQNRETGRQARKVYHVPLFLNPDDPADHNYRQDEMIVVCHEGEGMPKDLVFVGPPTPDMEPLDEEAEAITEAERPNWIHPIESLPGQGYGDALLADFQKQLASAIAGAQAAAPANAVSVAGISAEAFAKLQEQVAALAKQNEDLTAKLAEKRRA